MPRINLIGSSNLHTNKPTFGNKLAGLAPTISIKPVHVALPGYKVAKIAGNDSNPDNNIDSCGFNRAATPFGRQCIKAIGYSKNITQFHLGKKMLH